MMWVTTDTIAGYKVQQTLGPVRGSSVRAKWIGADIIAGLRNIFGGEITEYSKLLEETREQAISRMLADAENDVTGRSAGCRDLGVRHRCGDGERLSKRNEDQLRNLQQADTQKIRGMAFFKAAAI